MARNGAGTYSLPSGYKATTGEFIVADQHNLPLEDIRDDLNAARPIVAGGTGATTAAAARTNLSVYSIAGSDAQFVEKSATKADLKALDTATHKVSFVLSIGKLFTWVVGDFTDEAAGDPDEDFYIAADGVAVSLGIWRAASGSTAEIAATSEIADEIVIVAGISTDVTTVAARDTDIGTVADRDADIGTVAARDADIATVAGRDADIATVAGISTDVTTVAGISADVSIVATNVDDVTNFADVYQGGKASDPSTRNDGTALQAGDLYFNTTSDGLKYYTGTTWATPTGDMAQAVYAPNNPGDDAFSMDNMAEGTDTKIMTADERTKLADAMTATVYDPNAVGADAFDQDNMVDGTTNKNYTATEKTKLASLLTGTAGLAILSKSLPADVRDYLDIASYVTTRTAMKALDTSKDTLVRLSEAGRAGVFEWDSSDLSAQVVVKTVTPVTISSNTLSMRSATTTAINSTTNVCTKAAHGFSAGDEVYPTSTVDGLIANGRYFIYFDTDTAAATGGDTDNFKLRTSSTASAFDLTGTTNFTVKAPHNLYTGEAVYQTATANGVTAEALCYIIRTDANAIKLASSFANAHAGTAITLTGTTAVTLKHVADPLEGRFVIPTGKAADGSEGAFVRQTPHVNSRHCGATGDGSTDDGHAVQASVWLGAYLREPTYTPAGLHMSSTPIAYRTNDWLYNGLSSTQAPNNGITWYGDGQELTLIKCNSSFPDSTYLLTLDGNPNAIAQIVGSRGMAQGINTVTKIGFWGRGTSTGTDVRGLYMRGAWRAIIELNDFRDFSGDMFFIGSGATTASNDEVDNTSNVFITRNRFLDGGKSAFLANAVRIAGAVIRDNEIRYMGNWGINATLAYSIVEKNTVEGCGNRTDATTGGVRISDAGTGSQCRTNVIRSNTFENNFNNDIDVVSCRGLVIELNSFHTFLPTGGQVTGKASVKVRLGVTDGTVGIDIRDNRWTDYSAPSDGSIYEVPNISIAAAVKRVRISGFISDHTTSNIALESPNDVKMDVPDATDIVLTGNSPVLTYKNGVAIGATRSAWTPVVAGSTTAGVGTYTAQTGSYERFGQWIPFTGEAILTAHTGTGDILIKGLPKAAQARCIVALGYDTLTYTSAPFGEIVAGETQIRIRQAASGSGVIGVPIDAVCRISFSGCYLAADT